MPVFSKAFAGVPDGAIYPVIYQPGEDCPPELVAAAEATGALRRKAVLSPRPPASAGDDDIIDCENP